MIKSTFPGVPVGSAAACSATALGNAKANQHQRRAENNQPPGNAPDRQAMSFPFWSVVSVALVAAWRRCRTLRTFDPLLTFFEAGLQGSPPIPSISIAYAALEPEHRP